MRGELHAGAGQAVGLTQHLGLSPRWLDHVPMGGAAASSPAPRRARGPGGDAEIVACIAGDTNHVDSFRLSTSTLQPCSRRMRSIPMAPADPNTSFAFLTAYYMRTYGAQPEDFGKLCVAQRANALQLSPRAVQEAADARRISRRARSSPIRCGCSIA